MNPYLRAAKEAHDEVAAMLEHRIAADYRCTRDKDSNLLVHFRDETVRFPLVPLRPYQIESQKKLWEEGIKRQLLEWPRRSGKEIFTWNMIIQGAIAEPGQYFMVYPSNVRARAVLWDGSVLIGDRNVPFLDMIPKRLIASKNKQEMKIHLVNGSVIWIMGSDIDPDKLRGTNPRGIGYCEFAFQDPKVFHIMLPVLRQNKGWMIGQSTFDGQNHFYQLIKNNQTNPLWLCRVESITTLLDENGERYITDEMIEEDRQAGMPEYLIQQEYYGVVQINQETKYFAHAINHIFENNKLIPELCIPNAPLYTAWDIGMNDCTAIVLFQIKRVDNYIKPIVVGYLESNNRDLKYYIDEIRRFANRKQLIVRTHFIPHDGQKRDFNTGKNTIDFLREMGEFGIIVPRPTSKENAIEAMRRKLHITEFNKEETPRLIDCLSNYSKEYDDKMGTYKRNPVHNWASHGVDAYQTMTLALDGQLVSDQVYETVYYAT